LKSEIPLRGNSGSVNVPSTGSIDDIIILNPGGAVSRLSGKSGKLLWRTNLDISEHDKSFTNLAVAGNEVYVIGTKSAKPDQAQAIAVLNAKDGSVVATNDGEEWAFFQRRLLKDPKKYFLLRGVGESKATFLVANVAGGTTPVSVIQLGRKGATGVDVQSLMQSKATDIVAYPVHSETETGGEFVLKSGGQAVVVKVEATKGAPTFTVVHRFADVVVSNTTLGR
jgi:hypothetical protein